MADPVTPRQMDFLKNELHRMAGALRDQIREELLRSDDEQYIDIAGRVHDLGEESVADLLADHNIAMIDRHVTELRKVEAALRRLAVGAFGSCSECGEPIGWPRLQAVPSAARCVTCQSRAESAEPVMHFPKI